MKDGVPEGLSVANILPVRVKFLVSDFQIDEIKQIHTRKSLPFSWMSGTKSKKSPVTILDEKSALRAK